MISPTENFEYSYRGPYGTFEPIGVIIKPLGAEYLAWRLRISDAEAEELQRQRVENQQVHLPHLIGEYMVDGLGYGRFGLQAAHIRALVAHGQALGLPEQVYGGYRGIGFLRDGIFFGPHSADSAQRIAQRRQFHAAQVGSWLGQVGYAKNNPFNHMTRGERPGESAPILTTFAKGMLVAAVLKPLYNPADNPLIAALNNRVPTVDSETAFWQPNDGLSIEDTVQVVYHRSKV